MNELVEVWKQGPNLQDCVLSTHPVGCFLLVPGLWFTLYPLIWYTVYFFTITVPGRIILGLSLCVLANGRFHIPLQEYEAMITARFRPLRIDSHMKLIRRTEVGGDLLPKDLTRIISEYLISDAELVPFDRINIHCNQLFNLTKLFFSNTRRGK